MRPSTGIVISGASGFVGYPLFYKLYKDHNVVYLARHPSQTLPISRFIQLDEHLASLSNFLRDNHVDTFIHLAGLAHNKKVNNSRPTRSDFFRVNTCLTHHLASICSKYGVKQFIYMSSVAVHGSIASRYEPATPRSPLRPVSDYGISKLSAEYSIQNICSLSNMNYVILRPPLIYAKDCMIGNIAKLKSVISMGIPVPFADLDNMRAFVSLDNIVELIALLLNFKGVERLVLIPCDPVHYSTGEFVTLFSRYAGLRDAKLVCGSRLAASLARIKNDSLYSSLFADFCVRDDQYTTIGWSPVNTLQFEYY